MAGGGPDHNMRSFEYDNSTRGRPPLQTHQYANAGESGGEVKSKFVGFLRIFAQLIGVSTPSSSKSGERVEQRATWSEKGEARREVQRPDKRVP